MELERILHKHGFGTRRECRALVAGGRVAVAGSVCRDLLAEIETAGLVFSVDGVEWPYMEVATLVLHKPAGYECSRKPVHHPGVLELLPAALRLRGVQPVGRLDEDTTGLLVITDDGQLNHILSSARRKVPKIYRVTTRHPVDQEQRDLLLAGVLLNDEQVPIAAAGCEIVGEKLLRLTVTEGRYHQVKRMVAAAGNRVEALHREAVGEFVLPEDLGVGKWRWLTAVDLEKLGKSV